MAVMDKLLFTLNIFKGSSWMNLFKGLWNFIGRVVYAIIVVAIGRIADICQLIFKKLAGISATGVKVDGKIQEGDIVLSFLQHDIVKNLFFSLLVLAVIILIMATFVATIKTEFAKDGNNNKRRVIKSAFRGLANFVLVPVICMFGLIVGNALLRAIDGATTINGSQSTLSSQMFLAGGYNANRARKSENNGSDRDARPYKEDTFGAKLTKTGGGYGNFGIFLDDPLTNISPQRAADKIDNAFGSNAVIKVGTGIGTISFRKDAPFFGPIAGFGNFELTANSNTLAYDEMGIWYDGAFGGDLIVNTVIMGTSSGQDYWGTSAEVLTGQVTMATGSYVSFTLYNIGLVYYYYDLSIGNFSYLITGICMIYCAFILLITALGLVKRIFYLSVLFIISAPICATYPLDDGKILERWRTDFIKYALSAYSVVVVMNLFFSLLPLFLKMELFTTYIDLVPLPIPTAMANYFARILIVVGALLFFKDTIKAVAAIIGAADSTSDGTDKAKAMGARIAGAAGLAMGAAGAVKNKVSQAKDKSFLKKQENEAAKALGNVEGSGADGGAKGKGKTSMNTEGEGSGGGAGGAGADGKAGSSGGAGGAPSGNSMGIASFRNSDGTVDWAKVRQARINSRRDDKHNKAINKAQNKVNKKFNDKIEKAKNESGVEVFQAKNGRTMYRDAKTKKMISAKDYNEKMKFANDLSKRKSDAMIKKRENIKRREQGQGFAQRFGRGFVGFVDGVARTAGYDGSLGEARRKRGKWLSGSEHMQDEAKKNREKYEADVQKERMKNISEGVGLIGNNVGRVVEQQIESKRATEELAKEVRELKRQVERVDQNTKSKK